LLKAKEIAEKEKKADLPFREKGGVREREVTRTCLGQKNLWGGGLQSWKSVNGLSFMRKESLMTERPFTRGGKENRSCFGRPFLSYRGRAAEKGLYLILNTSAGEAGVIPGRRGRSRGSDTFL